MARSPDRGLNIPVWGGRRAQRALLYVKAAGRKARTPCCLCRLSIDYSLEHPHPKSCSVQHLKSRSRYPELTWDPSNWAPAHLECNERAGAGGREVPVVSVDLGLTSGW